MVSLTALTGLGTHQGFRRHSSALCQLREGLTRDNECSFECCPNYSFHLNIKLGQLCPLFALTKFHFSASSVKKIILIVCINWLYVINNAISDVGPKNHIAHIAHVALRSSEVREPPYEIMNYFRKCQ